jgi:DUF1680 family protein
MTDVAAPPTLLPLVYQPLALGTVKPAGWLQRQLEIQRDGLSGHLEEFWPDVAQSAWIGGEAAGWERGPYWLDGAIPLAVLLDDEHLLGRVKFWVDEILARQHANGWFGTEADPRVSDSGVVNLSHPYDPWPRFVLLKALTQWQEATGDERIIPAIERFLRRLADLAPEHALRSWGRYRWGDLLVSVYWLHERTGETWLLDLADEIHGQGYDWRASHANPQVRDRCLPEERDLSTHVVNNAMGLKGAGIWYRQSADPVEREGVRAGIETLDRYHGQATGAFSGDEHLAGRSPSQGTELCAVVEYMYSLETLLPVLGESWLGDRLEGLAYNALPATFSPSMWQHQYVQQVNQIVCKVAEERVYTSNGPDANVFGLEPHFGCCTANMHQGWPKFLAHQWLRTGDTDGLAAVSYAPCVVSTEVNGTPVTVTVAGTYPFAGEVQITVSVDAPVTFPLDLRIPAWAQGATVTVDGEIVPMIPDTFHRLTREWNGTTTLTLDLPMAVRVVERDHGSVSLFRGPLLLAMPIGEDWRYLRGEAPHDDYEIYPTTIWNVALVDPVSAVADITCEVTGPGEVPFTPDAPALRGEVPGRIVPGWEIERNAAGPVPQSPVRDVGEPVTVTLIPYGATNLRIAQFPVSER